MPSNHQSPVCHWARYGLYDCERSLRRSKTKIGSPQIIGYLVLKEIGIKPLRRVLRLPDRHVLCERSQVWADHYFDFKWMRWYECGRRVSRLIIL